jgi:hypothetical protein
VELRRIPVQDFDSKDLAAKLPQSVNTLRELLNAGHTVYLHCRSLGSEAQLTLMSGCEEV